MIARPALRSSRVERALGVHARRLHAPPSSHVLRAGVQQLGAVRGTVRLPAVTVKLLSGHHDPKAPFGSVRKYHVAHGISDGTQSLARKAEGMGYAVLHERAQDNRDGFLVFGSQFLRQVFNIHSKKTLANKACRENCQCAGCIHPDTRQRALDPFVIPPEVSIKSYKSLPDGATQVEWSDGHTGIYPQEWLLEHQHREWQSETESNKLLITETALPPPRECEQFKDEGQEPPFVLHDKVMSSDTHLLEWLENIAASGDFTADLTFKDTAYTNEGLAPHTDNTYFSDPARLQLFHLLSHTDGSGGESTMLDGFAAARKLYQESPSLYNSLATVRHSWHSSGNEDVCIQPSVRAPVFSIHPDFGTMYQVRWNYYDQLPKSDWSLEEQSTWYKAARRYYEILNEPGRVLQMQLEPGTALIFDNWRMMHGRTEFTGKRRMCGGYTNNDDFISRLRLLKFGREKVLQKMGSYWERDDPSSPYSVY
ncbi:Trimethyllysine dioxygenase [Penicillium chermesinum]|uniref:trimethyllysine dioxygenase n=1 Tax=Penicillium chermesinum TaxID=63820 RepID=A0A9W9TA22_9EURO|nr:Trimethyllysine dioxygenase [Penicillium chermesinum]KAJ5215117.1 Trimethyllysine dioxygenase [Penicillium chermesinum]